MEVAKVTSKGQITIPRDIRIKMDLKKGDKIVIFEENGRCFFKIQIRSYWRREFIQPNFTKTKL
jgi:AbrB family looped-hinge helix DNA binding protein